MAEVELEHVEKIFPGGTRAVEDLSLSIRDGEFMVLLGPSGCGKSTLLRMLAGLEETSAGEIRIGGQLANDKSPRERNVAMVFQNYALYPHMTVRGNLEFPLRMRGRSRSSIEERVAETARILGLTELLERRPRQLSGGQAQRVAMGRAMVREPAVFLMDEPLSNLDAKLRVQVRREIAAVHERTGTTTVYVTHDQVEAMTLGQRVAVLREGRLQQTAAPQDLYERPANLFVAGFVGHPPMNLFEAELHDSGGRLELAFGPQRLELVPQTGAPERARIRFAGLRPEAFGWPESRSEQPRIEARIEVVETLGHEQILYFAAPMPTIDADRTPEIVRVPEGQALIGARVPADRTVHPGETVTLAADLAGLHWFDERGEALHTGGERPGRYGFEGDDIGEGKDTGEADDIGNSQRRRPWRDA